MSYIEKSGKFNHQKWARENIFLENQVLTEEYVEIMDGVDEGLQLIKDAFVDWKKGPMTEREDIKPAQKELLDYVNGWLKKNIK